MAEIQKKDKKEDDQQAWSENLPMVENEFPSDRICPACDKGHLYYDHFLNLICDECGYVEESCFT